MGCGVGREAGIGAWKKDWGGLSTRHTSALVTAPAAWDVSASRHNNKECAVNLHAMLLEREAAGRPVTIGLIGAGKFGTMFLTQVRRTAGMHLVGLADLNVARAHSQLRAA